MDHPPRDPAQCAAADDLGVRPALLLQLPVRRGAVASSASACSRPRRLGRHGATRTAAIDFGLLAPLWPGDGHRAADHRRQSRRRLDPVDQRAPLRRLGGNVRGVMAEAIRSSARQRSEQGPQDHRPPGRDDQRPGAGRQCHARAEARRGAGPDRRKRRRQVDHRPRRSWPMRAAGCRITGGKVEIDGISIRDLDRRAGAATCAASGSPISRRAPRPRSTRRMTIMDQVCEMPVMHGMMTKAEAEGLGAANCSARSTCRSPETFGDRYPHQVSGGQLQRAMAAMAMSCRPDIMVFDEPTTALDVTTQIEVLALLARPDPRVQHGGALHHPRPRRGGAGRATASWCCATARWSSSATTEQILERAEHRLRARAGLRARGSRAHRAELAAVTRPSRCSRSTTSMRRLRRTSSSSRTCRLDVGQGRDRRRGRRIRLRQELAGARRSWACCRADRARSSSTARSCRRP